MKYICIVFLLLFCNPAVFAQSTPSEATPPPRIFTYVQQMPEPPMPIEKYISEHIVYPKDALKAHVEGKVVVKFFVRATGAIDSVIITRPLFPSLDSEAVRVVRAMPNWKPGRQNGHPTDVIYALPVSFRLPGKR